MNIISLHSSVALRQRPLRVVLCAALIGALACSQAGAEPGPGPHGPPPAPSAEELATIPALSAAQQIELRKILVERRNATEALDKRSHEAMDAQREKDRAEHERIDDQASERVRKLLGDEGFKSYAAWQLAHRGPPGPGGRGTERGSRPGDRPGAPPPPPAVGALTPPAPADVEAGS